MDASQEISRGLLNNSW